MIYKQPWKLVYNTPNVNDGYDTDTLEGTAVYETVINCNYKESIETLINLGITLYGVEFLTNDNLMKGFFGVQLPEIEMKELGVVGLEKQPVGQERVNV